jgi:hypothetical protein
MDRTQLEADYAELRTVLEDSYDWSGEPVDDPDDVRLPPRL